MKKTTMFIACAVSSMAFSGVTALADTNSFAPLKVNVQTKLPTLPQMKEIQVPTFADGLAELHNSFAQDSQQFSNVVVSTGTGESFSFSSGAQASGTSDVFSGLAAQLPTGKGGTLPDVQSGYAKQQQANEAQFAAALGTNPIKSVDVNSIAPVVPDFSTLTGGQASAVAGFISSHVPQLQPTGHQNLTATTPDGWATVFAAGDTPFTEAGTFADMQNPAGFGSGIAHQFGTLASLGSYGMVSVGKDGKPSISPQNPIANLQRLGQSMYGQSGNTQSAPNTGPQTIPTPGQSQSHSTGATGSSDPLPNAQALFGQSGK